MGSCISVDLATESPTAGIIALDGSLQLLPTPATTSDVIPPCSPSILCSSEALSHSTHIPSLDPHLELEPGHIYFVLPASLLGRPLTRPDMADLAVKASFALACAMKRNHSYKQGRKINATGVRAPVAVARQDGIDRIRRFNEGKFSCGGDDAPRFKIVRRGDDAGQWRKMGRSFPVRRRAGRKLSRRSYNVRLSPIYEIEE